MTPTCTLTTWSFQRAAPHTHTTATQHSTPQHSNTAQQHSTATQHSNTAQQHSTAQPFTRVCLEFLTTLTCRALYGKSHCHGQSCRFLALVFDHFDFQNTARESQCVSVPFETIEKKNKKKLCSLFFVSPGHLGTIQNLIPGWTTIVKLLKQVKNWQSPSGNLWSSCLINSREDDKGQSYYYSGRQKDNSKTICGRAGYLTTTRSSHGRNQIEGFFAAKKTSMSVVAVELPRLVAPDVFQLHHMGAQYSLLSPVTTCVKIGYCAHPSVRNRRASEFSFVDSRCADTGTNDPGILQRSVRSVERVRFAESPL